MQYSGILYNDMAAAPGVSVTFFSQGCPHHCKGCHNPETWDFGCGTPMDEERIFEIVRSNPLCRGVTFSGGEPFLWADELAEIGKAAAAKGLDVMTYTGYTYEQVLEMAERDPAVRRLLTVTNYLVDGRYEEENRDLTLKYRGSSNQRILDITCYPNSKNAVCTKWS